MYKSDKYPKLIEGHALLTNILARKLTLPAQRTQLPCWPGEMIKVWALPETARKPEMILRKCMIQRPSGYIYIKDGDQTGSSDTLLVSCSFVCW